MRGRCDGVCRRDAGGGAAVAVGGAVADFDDCERVAVQRDEIELAAPGAEIRRDEPVAQPFEVARRGRLGCAAELEMRRRAHGLGGSGESGGQGETRPPTICAQSSSRRTRPCASTARRPVTPGSGPRLPLRMRGSSWISR